MTYGEQIRKGRERKHLTQEALAECLNVSRQAVSKWEADKSRPAAAKLAALSKILDIPEETWAAIDAGNQAEPQGKVPSNRVWKIASAALALLLCCSILLNAALWLRLIRQEESPEPAAPDISEVFPQTLQLSYGRDYDFGDVPTGTYGDPDEVIFRNYAEEPQNQQLWEGYFGDDTQIPSTFLRIIKTNPVQESGTTFWDVYLLYAVADAAGELDWKILYRLAEENLFVNESSGLTVESFSNVLGREGFKINVTLGVGGTANFYVALRPDNTPCLMASVGGSGSGAVEFDVDEDGEKEIICPGGLPLFWTIYDTEPGQEGAALYTLYSEKCGVSSINFDTAKGGFVVTDSQENVMVRYGLRGDEMVRLPMTDFTALDYPDATGTSLTFDLDYFEDSVDPDTVLYGQDGVRITPRQQAYLALQELHDLTGLKMEKAYCAVGGSGNVCFSLLPDGFSERCFYSATLPTAYGGAGIPSFTLAWQELGNAWSPLKFSELKDLEGLQTRSRLNREDVLSWYYERLRIFRAGESAYANWEDLWLMNGDRFVGELQETEYGPALVNLCGPYPGGELHH